jgi:hypothetical protein
MIFLFADDPPIREIGRVECCVIDLIFVASIICEVPSAAEERFRSRGGALLPVYACLFQLLPGLISGLV